MRPFVILLMALLWSAPILAQSRTSEKEWNTIIEGAKKEGKVVVAGSPDPVMRNEIIPKFKERYGIPIEFIAGRSSEISARIKTERGSGIYSVDVYLSGPDTTATTLYGEKMIDPVTGSPHTAHTINPVPFHLIDEDSIGVKLRSGGALEDIAPTMLSLLGLEAPDEMTGRDLRELE